LSVATLYKDIFCKRLTEKLGLFQQEVVNREQRYKPRYYHAFCGCNTQRSVSCVYQETHKVTVHLEEYNKSVLKAILLTVIMKMKLSSLEN